MTQARVNIDFTEANRALKDLPGLLPVRIHQQGLIAAARVARKVAAQPDFAFNDRKGLLRRTIRARSARQVIRRGGGRQTRMFARITIGGEGARQGFLVEVGSVRAKGRGPLIKAVEQSQVPMLEAARAEMVKQFVRLGLELRSGNIRRTTARAISA